MVELDFARVDHRDGDRELLITPSGLSGVVDLPVIHGARLPAARYTRLYHASAILETVVRSERHFIYATIALLGGRNQIAAISAISKNRPKTSRASPINRSPSGAAASRSLRNTG